MEFTCTVFSVKLTEIFKVKFCTNYEKFILIFPIFEKYVYLTYPNLFARVHTHKHARAAAQTHTYATRYLPARIIKIECQGFNNLSYTIHLR